MFLGVDGGGTKTAYALIDASGRIRARHVGPSVSHLAVGFARATELLFGGIATTLEKAASAPSNLTFSFVGLPSYGEDSATTSTMDAMPATLLDPSRYRCGNDTVCSWAGSLACEDGISVIAGTGSIAYGEYAARNARAGGWGELIGDEGSAYWLAREGLNLFSRMSDGRTARGPLYELVRARFGLTIDLDLCARIYGESGSVRSVFAQFATLVHEAAQAGDRQASAIFDRGARELVDCVIAVRRSLAVPEGDIIPVSHSGGVFNGAEFSRDAFRSALEAASQSFEYRAPVYSPDVGAALYAAQLAAQPLNEAAKQALRQQCSP
ncbi:BadF/BadG/BcrA/BcrD ATPase family protein [Steroidobacter agaridevorans]|uniref:BadF/BadG/BcrA/BcrD ATPase family protein n=1 Tax=Steroidobacter agaridevorans TaxID=2695856 RepID=UPI00132442F3|nr:BadF/BadG/BcrA/BcrD ATPase family protein [Steroidobacter agaridevorans]GFE85396.1 N-acetylglucosamine kinase [Steroidobacter agaridevorans]